MKNRYIIFADDDADDLELITSFFKEYNRTINVLEFKDGKEVVKFLEEFAFNSMPLLIVLDNNMPRMNGKETLATIRGHARFKNIPVTIYTTSASEADQEYCKQYNASLINKPDHVDNVKRVAKILADFCQLSV